MKTATKNRAALAALALAGWIAGTASGQQLPPRGLVQPQDMPGPLKEVAFEQRLGQKLPLDAPFLNEYGEAVTLGDYFGERPVILTFVYYECPMLCTLSLNGVAKSLGVLALDVGRDIDVVAVSFDPGESPEMARQARADTLARYGRPGSEAGWHFLTGGEAAIASLTAAAGFAYTYLPEDDEYAHTSGIVIAGPDGTISQYFLGIEYPPRDVRLALVEASAGKIGSLVDQVLLYCFRFDPQQGKYTAATMRILRLTGGVFVLGLAVFVWNTWRRERSRSRAQSPSFGAA